VGEGSGSPTLSLCCLPLRDLGLCRVTPEETTRPASWAAFLRGELHRVGAAENFCCGKRGPGILGLQLWEISPVLLQEEEKVPPHLGGHLHSINHYSGPCAWLCNTPVKRSTRTSFLLGLFLLLELQGKRTRSECLLSWELLPLGRQTRGRTGLRYKTRPADTHKAKTCRSDVPCFCAAPVVCAHRVCPSVCP